MVEVQKPMDFCDFCGARATLCGNRRGRGAKTRIGVVEVQKLEVFCVFCCPRGLSRGSRACSRAGGSRVRFLPGPRAGVARCNLHFKATCAEQTNLHRPVCAERLAWSNLRRATYAEQLAQSNLRRAACTEQLAGSASCTEQLAGSHLQGPTCRSNLRGATCAEQLAQCNLRRATCADQLAPTSLRRAPCLVLSRACFTNASCAEKERILQRLADLACDVMLSGQLWSSFVFSLFSRDEWRVPDTGAKRFRRGNTGAKRFRRGKSVASGFPFGMNLNMWWGKSRTPEEGNWAVLRSAKVTNF